ncbi:uncharacterized protein LOC126267903 [Schistocerca gregaria]|uniref:uncharacterized protein LOC126267903 n=1 Tax=Schistocerca gregaria TaxID=7010 RepID=UPI00211E875F|nr:uncharacterized protein LOC126267903 [Schistocerca gregaria]
MTDCTDNLDQTEDEPTKNDPQIPEPQEKTPDSTDESSTSSSCSTDQNRRSASRSTNKKRSAVEPLQRRKSRNLQLYQPLMQRSEVETVVAASSSRYNHLNVSDPHQGERDLQLACCTGSADECSGLNNTQYSYYADDISELYTQQFISSAFESWTSGNFNWPIISCDVTARPSIGCSEVPPHEYAGFTHGYVASSGYGSRTTRPDWSTLPYLAVAKILSYLHLRDRYMAAITCKSWLAALRCPEVWQSCELRLQRSTPERMGTLASHVGRHVRRLTLHVTQNCGPRHACTTAARGSGRSWWCAQRQSRCAAQCLGALRGGGVCRLQLLRVWGLRRFAEWRDGRATGRIICALARFLHGQTQLRMLQLRDAALAGENALWLVRAAAYRSAATLVDVRLDGALGAELDAISLTLLPFPLPHMALHPLRSLRRLSLSPCQLCDHLLGALPGSLVLLVLVARRDDPPDPCLVSTDAWTAVSRRLPALTIELVLVGVVSVGGLGSLLPEEGVSAPVGVLRLEPATAVVASPCGGNARQDALGRHHV